jgi:glutamate N-acetyltransferase / amino-acid N-acetyltransferase
MISKKGLSSVPGFKFAGITTPQKKNQSKKNLGLIYSEVENTYGTAVYTRNDVQAAPVIISKKMDAQSPYKKAILINSGEANAFTGKQGIIDAELSISRLSELLKIKPEECYIGSTGVIGFPLKINDMINGYNELIQSLKPESDLEFVQAIMTTDTRPKQASIEFDLAGKKVTIAACAKGSGMIMPDMATMLCAVISDAAITPEMMHQVLNETVEETFNCITVDGDTSTNDTVFFLANGLSENEPIKSKDKNYQVFSLHLKVLLEYLAKEIVNDGEGITKFITVSIKNADTKENAKKIAFSIANSPLVKTAFFGENLNWGRILMAIGKVNTKMNCYLIDLVLNGFLIVNKGELETDPQKLEQVKQSLKNRDIDIDIDFNQGKTGIRIWTCDFSLDYVKINANYVS